MMLESTRFTVFGLNPNDVAAFITVLALSLPFLIRWWKPLVWLVIPLESLLISLLIGTGSRGGVLAFIAGLLLLIFLSWRSGTLPGWKMWTVLFLAGVLGLGGGLVAFPKGFRVATLDISPEASAGRRLEVWSTVPAMLASAPYGWGLGQSANAYEQWFEPVGKEVQLKHLLSSHLTWLVEFGWPSRWLYLFLWMGAIAILLPNRSFTFPACGVAVGTALLIALLYNAAGKWWNWPLPALWLVFALAFRIKQRSFPSPTYWLASALASAFLICTPVLFNELAPAAMPLHALDEGNIVLIGSGKPRIALLGPSKEVFGDFYGQEIRKNWSQHGDPFVIVGAPDASATKYLSDCDLLVISGEDETAFFRWRSVFTPKFGAKLVLINCRVQPDDWTKVFSRVVYYHGEFYGDPCYGGWKSFCLVNPAVSVRDLPAMEIYVANWWKLISEALPRNS